MCFKCLKDIHRKFSRRAEICPVRDCGKPYHSLLNMDQRAATKPSIVTDKRKYVASSTDIWGVFHVIICRRESIFLKILPVKLCGPTVSIFTYALIDDGSTVSLIDKRIVNRIGVTGERTRLSLKGISVDDGIVYLSKRVSCQIQGIPEGSKYVLQDVFAILDLRLPIQTITLKDIRSHPHLRDIDLATYDNVRPTLLLEQDNVALIVVYESKVGKKDAPAASRTKVGWALHGREKRTGFISQGFSREEENSGISEVSIFFRKKMYLVLSVKNNYSFFLQILNSIQLFFCINFHTAHPCILN